MNYYTPDDQLLLPPPATVPIGYEDPDLPWSIEGDLTAEWVMHRYSRVQHERARIDEMAAHYMEQVRAWQASMQAPLQQEAMSLANRLERYAIDRREVTKRATVKLPSGEIRTREVPASFTAAGDTTVDKEAAAAWLEERGQAALVNVVKSPRVSEVVKQAEWAEVVTAWTVPVHTAEGVVVITIPWLDGDVDAMRAAVADAMGERDFVVEPGSYEPVVVRVAKLAGEPVPWLEYRPSRISVTIVPS